MELRRILGLKRDEVKGVGKSCINMIFITYTLY
jgi:hypothetical protein